MEVLKIIKILTYALLLNSSCIMAQNFEKQIEVFSESYKLEELKQYPGAILKMKSINDDNSYEINLRLGWLSYLNGSLNESVTYYTKAITLMPYAIEPRLGIAYPLSDLGKTNDIIKHYNKILEIDPNNTLTCYRLGSIYYQNNNYLSAAKCFEKIVNLHPFDYDGLIMLAWSNVQIKKFREAEILFNKALMRKPNDPSAVKGLSLIK